MTPSQAAQEKPTSPRTVEALTDALDYWWNFDEESGTRRTSHAVPISVIPSMVAQVLAKRLASQGYRIEREAAAATPSLPDGQPCYRWEPVKNDCRRHHGPHEGFRCNGAMGRLIEVYHGTAAATPSVPLATLMQAIRDHLFPRGIHHPEHWSLTNDGAKAIAQAAQAIEYSFLARLDEGSATPDPERSKDDVGRLGLSDEQARNLRQHLIARQQTLGEWVGDVLFDYRMGRPDGIDYPPAATSDQGKGEPR